MTCHTCGLTFLALVTGPDGHDRCIPHARAFRSAHESLPPHQRGAASTTGKPQRNRPHTRDDCRRLGLCVTCCAQATISPHTGRPQNECAPCAARTAAYVRQRNARLLAAKRAQESPTALAAPESRTRRENAA